MGTHQPYDYKHGVTTVLGLDPSISCTGYGVLRGDSLIGAGKISTSPSDPEPQRIWIVFSEVLALIREFSVDHVAIEQFTAFFRSSKSSFKGKRTGLSPADFIQSGKKTRRSEHDREAIDPKAMFLLKAAQTATQLAALSSGCFTFLYPVPEWKGGLRVSKSATRERARLLYKVTTKDHNITDAIMIAHHHLHFGRLHPDRGVSLSAEDMSVAATMFADSIPDSFPNSSNA